MVLSRKRRIVLGVAASGLLFWGACDGCNGGVTAKESFMLAYIDNSPSERIRVRYSDDGVSWTAATLQGGIADAGISAAASADGLGAVRILAHNGGVAELRFRFGVGADVWDPSDVPFGSEPQPRGTPKLAYATTNRWLLTNLSGYTPTVRLYNNTTRSFSDVSPTATQLALGGLNVFSAPAIVTGGTRVLLSYMRFSGLSETAQPQDMKILPGDVDPTSGVPTWSNAYTFSVAETGFGPPRAWPAFAYDHTNFYLGTVRRATSGGNLRLFIYSSADGASWTLHQTFDQLPQVPNARTLRIGIAAKSDGTMLTMFTGGGSVGMYRTTGTGWSQIGSAAAFGSDMPNWYTFALIAAGAPPPP